MLNKQKGSTGFELIASFVILVIMFIIVFVCTTIWNTYSCNNYGNLTDRVTKYSIVNGCFVKTDSGWIPQEEMSKRAYGNSILEKD